MTRDHIFGSITLLCCVGLGVELAYSLSDAMAAEHVQVPARKPPVPAERKCHVEISKARNGKIVAIFDAACDLTAVEQGLAIEWGKVQP